MQEMDDPRAHPLVRPTEESLGVRPKLCLDPTEDSLGVRPKTVSILQRIVWVCGQRLSRSYRG